MPPAEYARLPAGERDAAAAEAASADGSVELGPGERTADSYPPRKTVAALSLGLRRHKVLLLHVLLVACAVPLVVHFVAAYGPLARSRTLIPSPLREARSILLVVAHPDDECLFFSPSVTTLLQRGLNAPTGHILVMSAGNHYGLGDQRRVELKGSCRELGVSDDHCEVLNESDIEDDPVYWWPEARLAQLIEPYVAKWGIDLIVTFDKTGVSGHINHRAVGQALRVLKETKPAFPPVYQNVGIFVLRKYAGLLDLPFVFLTYLPRLFTSEPSSERALLVGTWRQYFTARAAFHSHASQLVWDRYLSRYMYVNELCRADVC